MRDVSIYLRSTSAMFLIPASYIDWQSKELVFLLVKQHISQIRHPGDINNKLAQRGKNCLRKALTTDRGETRTIPMYTLTQTLSPYNDGELTLSHMCTSRILYT